MPEVIETPVTDMPKVQKGPVHDMTEVEEKHVPDMSDVKKVSVVSYMREVVVTHCACFMQAIEI